MHAVRLRTYCKMMRGYTMTQHRFEMMHKSRCYISPLLGLRNFRLKVRASAHSGIRILHNTAGMSLFAMAGAKHFDFTHPLHLNRCACISLGRALYVIGFFPRFLPRGLYLALVNSSKFKRLTFLLRTKSFGVSSNKARRCTAAQLI